MKTAVIALAALAFAGAGAQAQSMHKNDDPKQASPGATGAMNNSSANGVATDPGAVKAQSGNTKASPGTVGAAPGAATPSQTPKK